MNDSSSPNSCSGCEHHQPVADTQRRQTIKWLSMGISTLPFMSLHAQANSPGMLLVDADAEANFKPLRPADLALGKPMLVYPFDAKAGTPKNETRLNKLVVIRLPEDQMTPETRARSASSVLAYSGICTHQGCDVKTWLAKESVLACFCHASKFALLDDAKVVSGPALKPLPAVALTMEGEFLAIAPSSLANQGQ